MNVRNFSLVLALVAFSSSSIFAQTDFFWSFNDLNTGATNSDAEQLFGLGDSGTLYLYWAGGDLDTGAGLDLTLTDDSIIDFTGARTFDFAVSIGGVPIDNRWLDDMGGGGFAGDAQDVQANSVTGLNAFTVTGGQGILEANGAAGPFSDEGYDAGADAFLFASVDFTVVGEGSTDINTAIGAIGVVNGGQPLTPSFGNATINSVPEPATAGLLALGLVGLVARRRR